MIEIDAQYAAQYEYHLQMKRQRAEESAGIQPGIQGDSLFYSKAANRSPLLLVYSFY
jgi:hypothetical protein